jgi:tRNA(fMet)-specific endonuclease VapC
VSIRYLLDTNILSNPIRPQPNAALSAWVAAHQTELATAAPVWHEAWYGCRRLPASSRRDRIEKYLNTIVAGLLTILPYDERAALWHARERARLVAKGLTPSYIDGQIAAVAVAHDLALVTFNMSDFRHFAGLTIFDWMT